MNFSHLKVLMPGRGMLIVVVALVLLLGWFFYNAERNADHLIKRNFNFLNQVSSNLNASIEAATAAVPFNGRSVNSCIARELPTDLKSRQAEELERSQSLQKAMATCLNELKDRLVQQGSLVAQNSDIEISFAVIDGEAPFANMKTSPDLPNELDSNEGLLLSDIQASMVNIVPDGVLNMYYIYGAVPTPFEAQVSTDTNELTDVETADRNEGGLTRKRKEDYVEPGQLRCMQSIGHQQVHHNRHYIATFTMTIPYENIRGIDSTESFFDALIIARSTGKQSRVLFSNTEAPLKLDQHSMRKLFRSRSGFERFSSIREFELQNGLFHMPTDATGNPSGDSLGPMAFTQSSLVPVAIGGFSQLAFVQPFLSEQAGQQDFVLIGIVGESTFNKHKYTVPYSLLSDALLLLIVGVLSINFLRLKLIRDRGVIHRSDTVLACISMIGIASLTVVFAVHSIGARQFSELFDEDLVTLKNWISGEFQTELIEKIELIQKSGELMINGDAPTMQPPGPQEVDDLCKDEEAATPVSGKPSNTKYLCKLNGVPTVATLFLLNSKGHQDVGYVSHTATSTPLGFFIGARDYFTEIADGGGWTRVDSSDPAAGINFSRYFMQRIESKAAGSLETAISLPVKRGPEEFVAVGLAKFQSLEETVLPPGFGFAVFERGSGTVLFHSDSGRNLRENIYRATDDDTALKAAVVSGKSAELSLNYKGERIDSISTPLQNTQWSLLVYHRDSIVDVVNFHFGITALILAGSYILIWVIGLPLAFLAAWWLYKMAFVERLHRRDYAQLPPQWLYPRVALLPQYHKLALLLTLLVLAYIPMLYFWDLPGARLGVLFGLITAPAAWVFLLRGESMKLKPMGSATNQQFERALTKSERKQRQRLLVRTYRWFRINACLLVLLIAVLPTMLLHNENYDVHEKLWTEYTSWNFIDRLKARSKAYRDYLDRYDIAQDKNVEQLIKEKWRGVYLPRTTIYKLAAEEKSQPAFSGKCDKDAMSALTRMKVVPLLQRTPPKSKESWGEHVQNSIYIEVIDRALKIRPGCLVVPGENGEIRLHQSDSGPATHQSRYMGGLLGALPNIDEQGSMLESFITIEANSSEGKAPDHAEEKLELDAFSHRRLQTVLRDASSQLEYVVHSFFPHTRPVNWLGTMLFYLALALSSLAITSMLHGFLMRKFLSREFEEQLPELVRRFRLQDLSDGGIVIAPAGMPINVAYKKLMQELDLESDSSPQPDVPPEMWGMEQVQLVGAQKLLVIKNFHAVISDRQLSDKVMRLIRAKRDEDWCTLILSDIDLDHWLYHRMFAESMPEKEFFRWEALVTGLPTFMLPRWKNEQHELDDTAYALPKLSYRRTWQRCSEDEQMVLAGLRYEGVVNPRNVFTLRSLVRRRLIEFRNGHFEFGDNGWYDFVGSQMHHGEFKQRAQRYKNSMWLAFRGPMMLILLVLVLFIAYVAQDEMKIAFSVLGTVGAGAATLNAFGSRLRDLRGLTSL